MVGHLQSNKVTRAVELFDSIQSVNSRRRSRERIGRTALEAGRAPYPVYLQVNVDEDPAKAGFDPADLDASVARLASLEQLEIRGLMTVGRLVPDQEAARPTFRRAARAERSPASSASRKVGAGLSMGMSDDFEVAVEEGATLVRLGRVLFGDRPQPPERKPILGAACPGSSSCSSRCFVTVLWLVVVGRVLIGWVNPTFTRAGGALPVRDDGAAAGTNSPLPAQHQAWSIGRRSCCSSSSASSSSSCSSAKTRIMARVPARTFRGRLAQWLEHSVHIRGVTGSNPVSPTTLPIWTCTAF